MDFMPMNLRMMVPHAHDVGEIQHNLNQQSALQQDHKALEERRLIERRQGQVRKKDEAEGREIKGTKEEKEFSQKNNKRKSKSPKEILEAEEAEVREEPPMAIDHLRGRNIDISW